MGSSSFIKEKLKARKVEQKSLAALQQEFAHPLVAGIDSMAQGGRGMRRPLSQVLLKVLWRCAPQQRFHEINTFFLHTTLVSGPLLRNNV